MASLRSLIILSLLLSAAAGAETRRQAWQDGIFKWRASPPVIDVAGWREARDPHVAVKDPSVVFHDGRWHIYATLRMKSGRVCMVYLNFTDWSNANAAPREVVAFSEKYHGAPHVFFFTPHERWYLVYQFTDETRTPPFGPYFSTTTNIADIKSWTGPQPMVTTAPEKPRWLDFWVICDEAKAHLFYTTLDGHMWRRETKLADFPLGWSEETLAIKGDIFEASCTYKLEGRAEYLTLVEAQAPGRRYYKAYLADRLEGPWRGLADSREKAFASKDNIAQSPHWTDSISHGELLRSETNERLEVDPDNLRFLFQGASEAEYRGSNYGGIPWRLGLLESVP